MSSSEFDSMKSLNSSNNGASRKGPPFHGWRSCREIKIQNANCQTGDKTASVRKKMSVREVARR